MRELVILALVSAAGIATDISKVGGESPTTTGTANGLKWVGLSVGKETTLLTEPLRKDGTVDFIAAINERFGKGVTPENNAFVGLLPAMGVRLSNTESGTDFVTAAGGNPNEQGCYVDLISHNTWTEADNALYAKYVAFQQKPWRSEDSPELDRWLSANEKCLSTICAATKRQRFWVPLVSPNGWLSSATRGDCELAHKQAAELLLVSAMHHVGADQVSDAWEDLAAAHRLSHLIAQDYDALALVFAEYVEAQTLQCDRVILDHTQDRKLLTQIVAELESNPVLPLETEVLRRSEIFSFPDRLQYHAWEFKVGMGDGEDGIHRTFTKDVVGAFGTWQPDWDWIAKFGNNFYHDRFADPDMTSRDGLRKWIADSKANYDAIERATEADNQYEDHVVKGTLMGEEFLTPRNGETRTQYSERLVKRLISVRTGSIQTTVVGGIRYQKEFELMKVAFAVQLYRADTGAYPENAFVAARKYLKVVPSDFWNQSINYSRTDTGFKIESLGPLAVTRAEAERRRELIVIKVPSP
jgi:hypothetical protein